jgi:hypothetical protein
MKERHKQHDVRAASFRRLAKTLRVRAANYRRVARLDPGNAPLYWKIKASLCKDLAADFDNEAATLRAMR